MDYTREMWFVISFHCERCNGYTIFRESDVRDFTTRQAFCGNCGAAYVFYQGDDNIVIERTVYGEMYMPPLEWNEIFSNAHHRGHNLGIYDEVVRRQRRTFWQRLGDFIRNR